MRPWIMLGNGGHARVVADLVRATGGELTGYCAPGPDGDTTGQNSLTYLGNDEDIVRKYQSDEVFLVNGLGSISDNKIRRNTFLSFRKHRFEFPELVHPSAIVASDVSLAPGAQIMAGVVLQTGVAVGCNTIVNTRSSIDHDGRVGNHVHIAPGCTLSGDVSVADDAHLGTGCVVVQGIMIGAGTIVGAGATVLDDLASNVFAIGTPARTKRV